MKNPRKILLLTARANFSLTRELACLAVSKWGVQPLYLYTLQNLHLTLTGVTCLIDWGRLTLGENKNNKKYFDLILYFLNVYIDSFKGLHEWLHQYNLP